MGYKRPWRRASAITAIGLASAGAVPATSTAAEAEQEPVLKRAAASPAKLFLDGKRRARFEFKLEGTRKRDLVIRAIKKSTGKAVRTWRRNDVKPGELKRVRWDGRDRDGRYTRRGQHVFRVREAGGPKADASSARGSKRIQFYTHKFPLRGRHSYGDGFGAGRNHQGQDLFAACGNKVVAARGGRVQVRKRHSRAGFYVVIDGVRTKRDYVYMHLRRRGRPPAGARVKTGQVIGYNGRSGNASGCHLHFELWSRPGWYEGGKPRPPTRALRRWDGWS